MNSPTLIQLFKLYVSLLSVTLLPLLGLTMGTLVQARKNLAVAPPAEPSGSMQFSSRRAVLSDATAFPRAGQAGQTPGQAGPAGAQARGSRQAGHGQPD